MLAYIVLFSFTFSQLDQFCFPIVGYVLHLKSATETDYLLKIEGLIYLISDHRNLWERLWFVPGNHLSNPCPVIQFCGVV
jgi:hypothetical protein